VPQTVRPYGAVLQRRSGGFINCQERLRKLPEQGAATKAVRQYGEALQRRSGGFIRRD